MTAIALVTLATFWIIAALVCLAEAQSPDAVVAQVLDLPADVEMPLTV